MKTYLELGPVRRSARHGVAAAAAAAMVAGCGGGHDDAVMPMTPTASVPDSALVSSSAYTSFTLTTSQSPSETAEPLSASNVMVPPASETDEPVPVS